MKTLIFLLLVSAFGFLWKYRHDRYGEYETLKTTVTTAERNIGDRTAERNRLLERLQPLRDTKKESEAPEASPETLQKEVDALKDSLGTATAQLDASETEFLEAVQAVREKAKKQIFPLVKLASGKELKECTITSFSEGFVSISHSAGVDKVQVEDLPADWVPKYSLDYISRESKADREFVAKTIERATSPALDLRNAKVGDIKARITELEGLLLAMSAEMRNARRESDNLIRDAYRIAMEKGAKGQQTAAKRKNLFDKSKKVDAARTELQLRYKKYRDEKLELERQLVELTKRPGT